MANITIDRFVRGARNARGTVAIIDVLRANSVMLTLFGMQTQEIVAVPTVDDAFAARLMYPSYALVGEQGGEKVNGFDYGNSPTEILDGFPGDRNVIMLTSSGTRGINAARSADEIVIGTFLNYRACVDYLSGKEKVTLVAMGTGGSEYAVEDEKFAEAMQLGILGKHVPFGGLLQAIMNDDSVRSRFMNQNDKRFPMEDLKYCLQLDVYDTVPRVTSRAGYPTITAGSNSGSS
ncbi:MAG: 2-phosphosulfolactate phosphatase [archaeon]